MVKLFSSFLINHFAWIIMFFTVFTFYDNLRIAHDRTSAKGRFWVRAGMVR